jgi:hypothetical protein
MGWIVMKWLCAWATMPCLTESAFQSCLPGSKYVIISDSATAIWRLSCAIIWLAENVHTHKHSSRSEQGWAHDTGRIWSAALQIPHLAKQVIRRQLASPLDKHPPKALCLSQQPTASHVKLTGLDVAACPGLEQGSSVALACLADMPYFPGYCTIMFVSGGVCMRHCVGYMLCMFGYNPRAWVFCIADSAS